MAGKGYSFYAMTTLPAAEMTLDALALPMLGLAEGMAAGGPAGMIAYGGYKLLDITATGLTNFFNRITNSFVQGLIQNMQDPITGPGN